MLCHLSTTYHMINSLLSLCTDNCKTYVCTSTLRLFVCTHRNNHIIMLYQLYYSSLKMSLYMYLAYISIVIFTLNKNLSEFSHYREDPIHVPKCRIFIERSWYLHTLAVSIAKNTCPNIVFYPKSNSRSLVWEPLNVQVNYCDMYIRIWACYN